MRLLTKQHLLHCCLARQSPRRCSPPTPDTTGCPAGMHRADSDGGPGGQQQASVGRTRPISEGGPAGSSRLPRPTRPIPRAARLAAAGFLGPQGRFETVAPVGSSRQGHARPTPRAAQVINGTLRHAVPCIKQRPRRTLKNSQIPVGDRQPGSFVYEPGPAHRQRNPARAALSLNQHRQEWALLIVRCPHRAPHILGRRHRRPLHAGDDITRDDTEVARLAVGLDRSNQHPGHLRIEPILLARCIGQRRQPHAGVRHPLDHRLGRLRAHHAAPRHEVRPLGDGCA